MGPKSIEQQLESLYIHPDEISDEHISKAINLLFQLISITISRSSAAVWCAVATFDFLEKNSIHKGRNSKSFAVGDMSENGQAIQHWYCNLLKV
jgi:hypothetical protein